MLVTSILACAAAQATAEERTHAATGLVYDFEKPSGWDGRTPVELFVCLHGAGDNKGNFHSAVEARAPNIRKFLRIFVQSPDGQGWPGDADAKVVELARALQKEFPVRRVLGLGFSAGGYLTTSCAFPNPDVYEGVVIAGATYRTAPGASDVARSRFCYWSLGAEDALVKQSGGPEMVRKGLEQAKWDPAHYVIEVVPGLGHALDPASLTKAVDWVVARCQEQERMTADEKAACDTVPGLVKAGDATAIEAAAQKALAGGRRETRAYLAGKLKGLAEHADRALSLLGIRLAGACADPKGAAPLLRLLPKLAGDAERHLAAIEALGQIRDPSAVKPLGKLLDRWDGDGAPQVAAAKALGEIGQAAAVADLVATLAAAEKAGGREAFVEVAQAALRALTGQSHTGAAAWQAWLKSQRR